MRTARPCRRTRPTQPELSAPSSAPDAGAAYSRPTTPAPPPNVRVASSGNSARGMPNTMALMSMTNVPCRAWRPRRYRSPSAIDANPARGAAALRRQRAHGDQGQGGHAEGGDIDPVGDGDAELRDQQAGHRRSHHLGHLHQDLAEGLSGRQLIATDETRHHRRPRGRVDPRQPGAERGEHEQRPHRRLRQTGVEGEPDAGRRQQPLHDQQQPPAVDGVGQRATEQRAGEQRPELRQAEHPDGQRRPGLPVHLDRDGDDRELRAHERHQLTAPQQPELARLTQRRDVDDQPPSDGGDPPEAPSRLIGEIPGRVVYEPSRSARRPIDTASFRQAQPGEDNAGDLIG